MKVRLVTYAIEDRGGMTHPFKRSVPAAMRFTLCQWRVETKINDKVEG